MVGGIGFRYKGATSQPTSAGGGGQDGAQTEFAEKGKVFFLGKRGAVKI